MTQVSTDALVVKTSKLIRSCEATDCMSESPERAERVQRCLKGAALFSAECDLAGRNPDDVFAAAEVLL